MARSNQQHGKHQDLIGTMRLSPKPFGSSTIHTLGDGQTHVQFVAEQSAYIHQIRIGGRDLLLNYASKAELQENTWYRNHALLPFPNRLLHGQYSWNEQQHFFGINDADSVSALHGFGITAPFKVDRFDLNKEAGKVKLVYLHRPTEHPKSYPFLVRFEVELAVNLDAQTVGWKMSAVNLGATPAPVGLGWHPYFSLSGGCDQWKVQMPPNERVELDNSMPTGRRLKGLSSKQASSIQADWDDCFALTDPENLDILLKGLAYSLSLKQLGSTRYTQIYVPGDKTAIAIEPMTCNVNAFNEAKGEVRLASQASISTGLLIGLV